MGTIRAFAFDAYGTLFDFHGPVSHMASHIGPHAEQISRLWRQKQIEYSWLRSLMGAHCDFWTITGDALDYALSQYAASDPQLKQMLMKLYLAAKAYDDVLPALMEIRKQPDIHTAIISNGTPKMLKMAVRSAGIAELIDELVSAEDVGIFKPSPKLYEHAMHRLGISNAAEICFISANPWDAQAAGYFGFTAVRVDRFGLPEDKIPGVIQRTVNSMSEISALV